jgi:sporulation-control protein
MVFRTVLARLGAGSARVDTVLDSTETTPGGTVSGMVDLTGGRVAQEIDEIRVELVATVRVPIGDTAQRENVTFDTRTVARAFRIEPGEKRRIPFGARVPLQCPLTLLAGRPLPDVWVELRTLVAIPGAVGPRARAPVGVLPLPVQHAVLRALDDRGFSFAGAEVEAGRLRGSDLRSCQELRFVPPRELRGPLKHLGATFLADRQGVEVVLAVHRRGRLLSEGQDGGSRLFVSYQGTDVAAIGTRLDAAIGQVRVRHGGP